MAYVISSLLFLNSFALISKTAGKAFKKSGFLQKCRKLSCLKSSMINLVSKF